MYEYVQYEMRSVFIALRKLAFRSQTTMTRWNHGIHWEGSWAKSEDEALPEVHPPTDIKTLRGLWDMQYTCLEDHQYFNSKGKHDNYGLKLKRADPDASQS